MLKKWFSSSKDTPLRVLDDPAKLNVGDLVKFKPRQQLPTELQGETFEVIKVGCYQYTSGLVPEFTLRGVGERIITLAVENKDDSQELELSVTVPRNQVLALFEENNFAELWASGYANLSTIECLPELDGWLTDSYQQEVSEGEGYYFDRDMRGQVLPTHQGDSSEEFRYHECSGTDDRFGLTVEVWTDGSTEVYLQAYCSADVIEEMWPHEDNA